MMAQPSYAPTNVPVSVIDSKYAVPYERDFIVVTNSAGDHLITDANDNTVMFKVKPCHTICHNQLGLLDREDKLIVTLRNKIRSVHNRWNVFMGNGNDEIFSIKKENVIQSQTSLHVFLASNQSSMDACDFKITGSWSNRNYSILLGDSSKTIAQMHPMQLENERFYKEKFKVTVYPNVDGAFVITLVAIIEAMKSSSKDDYHTCHVNDGVGPMTQGVAVAAQIVGSVAAVAQVVIS